VCVCVCVCVLYCWQLRAKVLIGGILPSEAPPGSALAEAIAAIEEEMEDDEIEDSVMQRALEALGISQELIDRLKKVTRERKQVTLAPKPSTPHPSLNPTP